ncbi:MAG: glycine zipper 2TM domain-containing protein [Halomonas sp.]|uniref:glycine zipper 2TM domain-containing protein n=1 Tax=Halomonas sp. TaxID=1486246 RepID=UPI00185677F1|nr:glycine zipper 2TM domain-containing protein [Halomonas sp.]NWN82188.1 glycine zipper 2TM domain-containing protein [Halomonas sp.]
MSKSIVVGTTLAVLGLGGMAFGAWQIQQPSGPEYAEILAVQPVTQTVERPREVCEDVERVVIEEVPVEAPPTSGAASSRDPQRIVGGAAGAIVGGLLGNQVGGGSGKKIATVAGAIGGALAGREVQERVEARQHARAGGQVQYETRERVVVEEQCETHMEAHEETLGYDVTYRLDGEELSRRLESAPQAERLPVNGGEVQWQAEPDAAVEASTEV